MEEKERNLSFNWYGSDITFSYLNGTSMINATEMAKPFKKRPSKWLELPSTKEFLKALIDIRKLDINYLIVSQKSGNIGTRGGGCTWFHEDVALEYARWLSPIFAVWCNDCIKDILRQGYAVRDSQIQFLQTENGLLQTKCNSLENQLNIAIPKANYCDKIIDNSVFVYNMTDIVKGLGINSSAKEIYSLLEEKGIIFRNKNKTKWYIKAPYDKFGYTKVILTEHPKDPDKLISKHVWTEVGKQFILTFVMSCGIPVTSNFNDPNTTIFINR